MRAAKIIIIIARLPSLTTHYRHRSHYPHSEPPIHSDPIPPGPSPNLPTLNAPLETSLPLSETLLLLPLATILLIDGSPPPVSVNLASVLYTGSLSLGVQRSAVQVVYREWGAIPTR